MDHLEQYPQDFNHFNSCLIHRSIGNNLMGYIEAAVREYQRAKRLDSTQCYDKKFAHLKQAWDHLDKATDMLRSILATQEFANVNMDASFDTDATQEVLSFLFECKDVIHKERRWVRIGQQLR